MVLSVWRNNLNLVFQVHLSFADGNWSPWSPWINVTKNNTEIRTRWCNNPAPANEGLLCTPGLNTTTEWINGTYVETETRRYTRGNVQFFTEKETRIICALIIN